VGDDGGSAGAEARGGERADRFAEGGAGGDDVVDDHDVAAGEVAT
jgi:hypothetical protein